MSYLLDFKLSEIATNRVRLSAPLSKQKEGFFNTFVVLILECRKIEKD